MAWLSQVIHHLPDIEAAARELARVVCEEGLVVVRNNFKGRLQNSCRYYEFFPTGLIADERRFPTLDHVQSCFEMSGFRRFSLRVVEQTEADSLREYAARVGLRTYSTFELLSEQDYSDGIARLERAAALEQNPQCVTAKIDLLVFQREGRRSR